MMILVPRTPRHNNCFVSEDRATYSEVKRYLCALLLYIGKEAGLFVGYKLVSESCGRGVREEASPKARQCKACPHAAGYIESLNLYLS